MLSFHLMLNVKVTALNSEFVVVEVPPIFWPEIPSLGVSVGYELKKNQTSVL